MISQQIRWMYIVVTLMIIISIGINLLLWPKQPYYTWGILILLVLLAWIAIQPLRGVFLSILLTGFIPQAPQEIGFGEIAFLAIFGTTLVSWLLKGLLNRRLTLRAHPVTASLIALFSVFLLSMPLALAHDTTLYEWARGLAPFAPLLIFFILTTEARDERVYRQLLWAFMSVGLWLTLQIFFTFWQERLWEPISSSLGGPIYRRVTWIFASSTSPLILAGALIALVEAISSKSAMQKLAFWATTLLLSGAILLTLSRSEIAILIISSMAVITIMLLKKGVRLAHLIRPLSLIGLLFIVLMGTTLISPILELIEARTQALVHTVKSIIQSESNSAFGDVNVLYRFAEIRIAFQAFREHPLLGQGLGYSFEIPSLEESDRSHHEKVQYVHNIIAYFLMTTGLLGTTIFTILVLAALFTFWKKFFLEASPAGERILLASGVALMALWLYGVFFAVFRTAAFNLFIGTALAILTCHRLPKAVDKHR